MATEGVSQTPLWLSLGVIFGAAYSLSSDHYQRAQTHSHLYIRAAMLGLSCATWLASASFIGYICYRIRIQDAGLDGIERVFSVLIPVVVRADLVVDWGKRVTWAVFLMPTWTQACVSLRRVFRRAGDLSLLLDVDTDVVAMATGEGDSWTTDMLRAEDTVWSDGAESLARISEMFEHLRKLARVSAYAAVGLVGAVPGAIIWVFYGGYKGIEAWRGQFKRLALLYFVSIAFAPVGAIVVVFVSAFVFVGIVSLSVGGALVAFGVHWSTRLVYSVLRMGLCQLWAEFPFVMRREGAIGALRATAEKVKIDIHELPTTIGNVASIIPGVGDRSSKNAASDYPPSVPASVVLEHANPDATVSSGADVAIPVDDGRGRAAGGPDEDDNGEEGEGTGGRRISADGRLGRAFGLRGRRRRRGEDVSRDRGGNSDDGEESESSLTDTLGDGADLYHGMHLDRHPDEAGAAIAHIGILMPTELEFALASWEGNKTKVPQAAPLFVDPEGDLERGESSSAFGGRAGSSSSPDVSAASTPDVSTRNSRSALRDARYMTRLGFDAKVDTPSKRRLTTYYTLGMLVQLQVSSGGNSWLLRRSMMRSKAITDVNEFVTIILGMRSPIASEAAVAALELSERLYRTPRYRTVPIAGRNIEVGMWVRAVLLVLLHEPGKVPSWMPADAPDLPRAAPPARKAKSSADTLAAAVEESGAGELRRRTTVALDGLDPPSPVGLDRLDIGIADFRHNRNIASKSNSGN